MVIFQAAKNQTPRPVGHAQDAADEALRHAGVASKRWTGGDRWILLVLFVNVEEFAVGRPETVWWHSGGRVRQYVTSLPLMLP